MCNTKCARRHAHYGFRGHVEGLVQGPENGPIFDAANATPNDWVSPFWCWQCDRLAVSKRGPQY